MKPVTKLWALRYFFGIFAAAVCTYINVTYFLQGPILAICIPLLILIYLLSYVVARNILRITSESLPRKHKDLIMQGIFAYVIAWFVFWVLFYTLAKLMMGF